MKLTKRSLYRSFQNSYAIETGLSDFHKMIVTILKIYFQKKEPKIIQYRDYKHFSEEEHREWKAYNKQRNYCVWLIRKLKKDYYNNLDNKKIIDNKSFWKYVKPLFTEKNARSIKITLVEDNSLLENNDKIAETFNNFFTSDVSNIPPFVDLSVEIDHIEDLILRIIEQYKNHPSVVAINEKNLNE